MCNLVPVTSPDTGTVVVVEPARVARALRHPVRRAALATVLARDGAVSRESIAAAVRDGGAAFGATVGDGSRLRTALYHRHLPLLASADLVCLTGAGVAPGGHPLLDHSAVDPAGLCRDGADWDALGVVVGQPRRRTAVRLLTQATLPVALGPLARGVAAERVGDISPGAQIVDDLAARFHHVDLPLLDDAEVVAYDATDRTVTTVRTAVLPIPVTAPC